MDTPSLIPEIKSPVLVVACSEDDVVEGLVEAVQPIADGERVNLIVLDGADHWRDGWRIGTGLFRSDPGSGGLRPAE